MSPSLLTRRGAPARLSNGFGLMAFSTMIGRHSLLGAALPKADADAPGPRISKAVAPARSVIFCCMSGGVSHVDSFDPKPRLQAEAGQAMPMPVARTQFNNNGLIQPSAWAYQRYGQSGLSVSDLFPHVGRCADDLMVVRSMTAKFSEHTRMANQVDQPIAGLLKDLKSRGLLETTLFIWAGEFGRTPFSQGTDGRDHHPFGFSIWMAGGGVKAGSVYRATDEYGYHAVENPVTVYDLWANVLDLLGLNPEALTFLQGGRHLRLIDVHGSILPAWRA